MKIRSIPEGHPNTSAISSVSNHDFTICVSYSYCSEHTVVKFFCHAESTIIDCSLFVLQFTPILFFSRTYFSFLAITHPSHVIGPLTPLAFVIASFHPPPRTSLIHSCLLVCTSSRFHRIPPCSICFVIVPELSESRVYKPSTRYVFP